MRVHLALLAAALLAAPALPAQSQDTEIYLAPIRYVGDSIVVGRPVNVTRRAGYDNQPSFTADSRAILYTAQRDGQTDIHRYDIASRATRQLTRTPESEYSPAEIPGQRRFSVIRVERDSTQRLWSFDASGRDPRLLMRDLKPVGYHAWLPGGRLAAYILGTPATLHLIGRGGTGDTIIARDVGRAVQALPEASKSLFSFTQRDSAGKMRIRIFTGRGRTVRFGRQTVTILPPGSGLGARKGDVTVDSVTLVPDAPHDIIGAPSDNEFHAWSPDATLVTASQSILLRWNGTPGAGAAWLPIASLREYGVRNVSRLAFSADGAWMAFVAEPVAP